MVLFICLCVFCVFLLLLRAFRGHFERVWCDWYVFLGVLLSCCSAGFMSDAIMTACVGS